MKRWNIALAATIVLSLSASALASSIGDPGGIIRSGINYDEFAIIGENFSITFNGEPLAFPFNPFNFTDSFCPVMDATLGDGTVSGPDCQFLNESGQTINSVIQFFSASPGAFTADDIGGLSCFNQVTDGGCSTGPGNALLFFMLGIPSAEEYSSILGFDAVNTDPEFNIVYFGFDDHTDLASIRSMSIPEPASIGLMLAGLLGLGLARRRRMSAASRLPIHT